MAGQINISGSTDAVQLHGNDDYTVARDFTFPDASGELLIKDANDNVPGVGAINGGQIGGFRNQIINGDFRIWQRGTGPASNQGINNELSYTADRWGQYGSAAATGDRGSDAPANGMFGQAISFSNCSLQQRIEIFDNNSPFVLGSTWTLSYYSKGGALQIAIDASFIGGSSTDYVAATSPSTTSAPDANGFTYNTFTFTLSGGVAPNAHDFLTVAFIGTSADTRLTGVQLEPGSVATLFEHRPIGTELALCQRYYQKLERLNLSVTTPTAVTAIAGQAVRAVVMRATPINTLRTAPNVSNEVNSSSAENWFLSGDSNSSSQAFGADLTSDAEL